MPGKPGRGAVRTTGNKRAAGLEQAGGAVGPIRDLNNRPSAKEKKLTTHSRGNSRVKAPPTRES